jgi:hypothetical protein
MSDDTVLLQGNEALSKLVDIWLDGFTSGASSMAATLGRDGDRADALAQWLVAGIRSDPLAVEQVRREIFERMAGVDSGLKAWELPS